MRKFKLSESQTRLINEVNSRHQKELNEVLNLIAKEHGILDEILANPSKWAFTADWTEIFEIEEETKDEKSE